MGIAEGVVMRGGVYQFQLKVPKDLAAVYKRTWAERKSLHTSDRLEANRHGTRLRADWLDRFAADRRRLNPATELLTTELVQRLAAAWAAELLSDDAKARLNVDTIGSAYVLSAATFAHAPDRPTGTVETAMIPADLLPRPDHGRFDGYSSPQLAALQQEHMRTLSGWQDDRAKGHLAVAQRALDWQAHLEGIKINWDSAEARTHLAAFQCSMIECAETLVARSKGQASDSERVGQIIAAPSLKLGHTASPVGVTHTIFDALEAWRVAEPNRPAKSVSKYEAAAKLFDAHLPDRALESLTAKDGAAFTEKLKHLVNAAGRQTNTAKGLLVCIAAMLAVAVKKEWCPVHPLKGESIKSVPTKRDPWESADLPKLFDHPVFTAYQMPTDSRAGLDAAYWVPLLGLYTGARIGELCQLMTSDVSEESPGMLVILIKAEADEGQKLKNDNSYRAVPVHSALGELGFADYWRAVSNAGARRLFPALRITGKNGPGNALGTWFSGFKTKQGFGPNKVFHSFRHTFATDLDETEAKESHIDALTGHAAKGTRRKVYATTLKKRAEKLRPALELLTFPGLSLPRVFERPAWTPDWKPTRSRVAKTTKTTKT